MRKEFRERRPTTWYTLMPKGRRALASHLKALRQLIHIADESISLERTAGEKE